MSHHALVAVSSVLGMAMVLGGIALNRDLGGGWLDMPWRYKPLALKLYFGGGLIFLAGIVAVALFY